MFVERGKDIWLEEGNFKDGKLNGWGRKINKNSIYTGVYKLGQRNGKIRFYKLLGSEDEEEVKLYNFKTKTFKNGKDERHRKDLH